MLSRTIRFAALALCTLTSANVANAQAYCALRDPVRTIYASYPEANTYRSIVRVVGAEERRAVRSELPFDLHFNELGQHTLYVATRSKVPLGFVHVRSEKGRWGLVEVAWALDLDLRVKDYRFQRCRERHRSEVQSPAFRAQIVGKSLDELAQLLSSDGKSLDKDRVSVGDKASDLALLLVRGAMKTISVTEEVWGSDIEQIRQIRRGLTAFSGGDQLSRVGNLYSERVLDQLTSTLGDSASTVDRDSVEMIRVRNSAGTTLGVLVTAHCTFEGEQISAQWAIGANGEIQNLELTEPSTYTTEFRKLVGAKRASLGECKTPVKLVAFEILTLAANAIDSSTP